MPFVTGVIAYFFAVFVQHGLRPPSILETMEMHLYAGIVERSDLMEQIEDTPVVNGVGNVQTDDM